MSLSIYLKHIGDIYFYFEVYIEIYELKNRIFLGLEFLVQIFFSPCFNIIFIIAKSLFAILAFEHLERPEEKATSSSDMTAS